MVDTETKAATAERIMVEMEMIPLAVTADKGNSWKKHKRGNDDF